VTCAPRVATVGAAKVSQLAVITPFVGLAEVERAQLERACTTSEPRDGAEVFRQGDPADAAYAIIAGDGQVRIGVVDRHGKSLMATVVRTGEIFGELGVIDGSVRSADAVVEGHVRLMRIPRAEFLLALSRHPALGEWLCRSLAPRLRRTFELLQDASFETLEVRLARQVLYLADRDSRLTEEGIRLTRRLRQRDLADLLGATTRSIITILNAWRAEGLVRYDTEHAILTLSNPERLRSLVHLGNQ
jgi:CRP/FNR family transcriptional regulator, cyclic AMP receptor protein